jgi:predicted alpha/beta superfamily hydrolase
LKKLKNGAALIKASYKLNEEIIMEVEEKKLSDNVYIIDKAFYMPQLQRSRRIWLYLPPEYRTSRQHYPVLYMQDGQNLFEDWSAFGEEWGIDETLNAVKSKCILVGIDNAMDRRLNEYALHDHERYGKGEGASYLSFLVNTLKPYIDETYRTLSGREHTFIAGSSLGALISFYAMLHFPGTFGAAGIFSPAFWIAPDLERETQSTAGQNSSIPQRYYFYWGKKESAEMASNATIITGLLKTYEHCTLKTVVNEKGTHSETEWRAAFPRFYKWLMQKEKRGSKVRSNE